VWRKAWKPTHDTHASSAAGFNASCREHEGNQPATLSTVELPRCPQANQGDLGTQK
jgi:hypothetical protein